MDLTAPKKQNFYVVSKAVVDNGKALLNYHQRKLQDQLLPKNFIQKQTLIEQFKQIFQPFNCISGWGRICSRVKTALRPKN